MKKRISLAIVFVFAIISVISVLSLNSKKDKEIVEEEIITLVIEEPKKEIDYFMNGIEYNILDRVRKNKDRIKDELSRIPEEYHKKVLALCWTESNLRYDVVHKGSTDSTTVGICGIKPNFWNTVLEENDAVANSLYGGYIVLKYLEEKKGSFRGALKSYKGAKRNNKPVEKVIVTLNSII